MLESRLRHYGMLELRMQCCSHGMQFLRNVRITTAAMHIRTSCSTSERFLACTSEPFACTSEPFACTSEPFACTSENRQPNIHFTGKAPYTFVGYWNYYACLQLDYVDGHISYGSLSRNHHLSTTRLRLAENQIALKITELTPRSEYWFLIFDFWMRQVRKSMPIPSRGVPHVIPVGWLPAVLSSTWATAMPPKWFIYS